MSNNAQLLVKEHKDKFYIFDVMAEGWGVFDENTHELLEETNYLSLDEALASFNTRDEAHTYAHKLCDEDPLDYEYGVVDEVLYKDREEVVIKEDKS